MMGFKPPSEAGFQQTVIEYARMQGWWVMHIRDSRGSEAGLPDLMMLRDNEMVFAELKTENGKLSEAQEQVGKLLRFVEQANNTVEVYLWKPSDWKLITEILK